jgi:hypothetical protein
MKTPVVSYRTKWPTGWKSEWFYVKIDEEKEKLFQSPLKLIFGLTRPQCNMTPGDPCQDAVYEFRRKRVNSFGCLISLSSKNTSRNPAKNGWTRSKLCVTRF